MSSSQRRGDSTQHSVCGSHARDVCRHVKTGGVLAERIFHIISSLQEFVVCTESAESVSDIIISNQSVAIGFVLEKNKVCSAFPSLLCLVATHTILYSLRKDFESIVCASRAQCIHRSVEFQTKRSSPRTISTTVARSERRRTEAEFHTTSKFEMTHQLLTPQIHHG